MMSNSAKPTRLGILGGTFDPPHIGHMLMAQSALETFSLDQIVFVPAGVPPHKRRTDIVDADHRLGMVEAATRPHPEFSVDPLELRRDGRSYTIDTIHVLRERDPDCELFFLIGADSLRDLHAWMRIDELLPLCRFLTFVRPGESMSSIEDGVAKLPQEWQEPLLADITTGREFNVSSTEIRGRVTAGLPIRYLVPDVVLAYINEFALYT